MRVTAVDIILLGAFILVPLLFFAAGTRVDLQALTGLIQGAVPALNGTNVKGYPGNAPN